MTTDDSRVWLITGSSSGFGRALATAALHHGDRLVATARRPEVLDDLVAVAPDRVSAIPLDITDPHAGHDAIAAAVERFGRLDVLVNNAGYGSVGAVEEIDPGDLRTLMETMFFGAVTLTQAALPQLRAQGSGAIVQISSMGGQVAPPGFGAYCAAKFALEAISESLAAEVAPLGIHVLIVEPGAFRTEFGGARMHRSRELAAYAPTVGPTRAYIDGSDGTQRGDPAKAAAAILAALSAEHPPLRLALGDDAVDAIRDTLARRQAELTAWEPTSRATAFAATARA
ncbi:MAG TPA: oxidoreductase [Solirubrobacteraceae bacterium]|nr:oxidoreductase [Solirubrobacteraceae bacterium]